MSSRFILPFADVGSGIKPSSGAKLFFFETDGVTPKNTFSDQLSTPTPNTDPVIADSNGVFGDIYITGEYKVTLQNKNGSQIFGLAAVEELATGNLDTTLINDLSQAYEFPTVAAYKAFATAFPVGKVIHLLDRGAGFTVIAGTGTADEFGIIASSQVNQSIDITIKNNTVSCSQFGAVDGLVVLTTGAVQAAFDSAAENILIDGQYLTAGLTLSSNKTYKNSGNGKLKLDDGVFGAGGHHVFGTGVTNVTFTGVEIDVNESNQTGSIFGVFIRDGSDFEISNNVIYNADFGIGVDNAIRADILNNTIKDGTTVGIIATIGSISDTSLGLNIRGNTVFNIKTNETSGADGKGIFVTGQTGLTDLDYKNITEVVIANNICRSCAVNGILLIAVNDYTITGNDCSDNNQNTTLAAGITISENCFGGAITGNVCSNNGVGGIQLDVVNQSGTRFGLGRLAVTGNTCNSNADAGIRIQSAPYASIVGNACSDNTSGVLIATGAYYTITGNSFYSNSDNGVRVSGIGAPSGEDGTNVIISDNMFVDNSATAGSTTRAISVSNWDNVKITGNMFSGNSGDLNISSTATNTYMHDNRFTSSIFVSDESVVKWEDDFHNTITSFTSDGFGGEGKLSITVTAGFTIPHFGRSMTQLSASAPVTSDLTTAMFDGYQEQVVRLLNGNVNAITIKQAANTENIGNADVVLAFGEYVEYTFTSGGIWLQTTAKIATSL